MHEDAMPLATQLARGHNTLEVLSNGLNKTDSDSRPYLCVEGTGSLNLDLDI